MNQIYLPIATFIFSLIAVGCLSLIVGNYTDKEKIRKIGQTMLFLLLIAALTLTHMVYIGSKILLNEFAKYL